MAATQPIRLSALTDQIGKTLHDAFREPTFWVIADISNHTFRAQNATHFFDLAEKDPDSNRLLARIAGRAWGRGSDKIGDFEQITGQQFTDNIHVLVNVSVQYHPVYGLQLNMNDIDPRFTLGVLEQQRQATLERLVRENAGFIRKEGDSFITRNNQLKLNAVIQRIAVISSSTSAGAEDFKHTLLNNSFGYQFSIDDYFTAVQGENNADRFLEKIIGVFHSQNPYDVLVIIRGGGAQTDFLIFDNYRIGRAVAKFPIPVITGIGHHKNESIADLMAHTQTKTPTKAAEFIIAHNRKYESEMLSFQNSIIIRSQQLVSFHFQSLASLNSNIVNNTRNILARTGDRLVQINQAAVNLSKTAIFKNKSALVNISSGIISGPRITLYNKLNDIRNLAGNIRTFKTQYLKNQSGYLGHYTSIIKMMSPENILNKGFALVKINGKIIASADELGIGSDMDIILSGTQIRSTVKQKSKYNGADFNLRGGIPGAG